MIDSKDYKTYKVFLVYGPDDSECLFNVKATSYAGAVDVVFDILEAKGLARDEAQQLLDEGHYDHSLTIQEGEYEEIVWGKNYFNWRVLN